MFEKVGTITKAVIPAAGRGTRMISLTGGSPKEMLLVAGKPLIERVVEEAIASGIREICIVVREGKEIIKSHFDLLRTQAKQKETELGRAGMTFVFQPEPHGLGDALFQARDFVAGESFAMIIPDQLAAAGRPATLQLLEHGRGGFLWSSLVKLPKAELPFFTGARGFAFERVDDSQEVVVQRLLSETETSALYEHRDYEVRGFGRTIFPPQIFDFLGAEFANPQTGEVDLQRTFAEATKTVAHRGVLLQGEFFDLGTVAGYLRYAARFKKDS